MHGSSQVLPSQSDDVPNRNLTALLYRVELTLITIAWVVPDRVPLPSSSMGASEAEVAELKYSRVPR